MSSKIEKRSDERGDTDDIAAMQLRPGPLMQRAIVMQGQKPFDCGTGPDWGDLTPHPMCETTREQYPEPRACSAIVLDTTTAKQRCFLGHPANCRWLIASMLAGSLAAVPDCDERTACEVSAP